MTSKAQKNSGYLIPTPIDGYNPICVQVVIPNEDRYKQAFLGAVYSLTKWWMWEKSYQPNDRRARDTAEYWRSILQVNWGCDGSIDMMLRQSPDDSCILQASYDGGFNWVDVFDYSLCLKGNSTSITNIETSIGYTHIEETTNIYNSNPAGFEPQIANSDPSTDTAYCYALRAWIRTALAGILESKKSENKQEEIVQAVGIGFAVAVAGLTTGGLAVPFVIAVSGAVAAVMLDYINDIEESTIQSVIDSDTKIEQLVCCAYETIAGSRIDPTLFGSILNSCDGLDSDVAELRPILHDMAGDFANFLEFLELAGLFWDYASDGILNNDCNCDVCEVVPAPNQVIPAPTIEYLGNNRWRVTASQYPSNNKWYTQIAMTCGGVISNMTASVSSFSNTGGLVKCDATSASLGTTLASIISTIDSVNGNIYRLAIASNGGNSVQYWIEFDYVCT